MYQKYPKVGSVKIKDKFWTEYLNNIRRISMPYIFGKMEEVGYVSNFSSVAAKDSAKHIGPPFSDGLLFEAIRGACDFLAAERDVVIEAYIDKLIGIVISAQSDDGFLCTQTMQDYPNKRWGDNGGDIVEQHDLYDMGCLIEAAISHYNATGKTTFLAAAVKSANLIVKTIGPAPKKNIIPGHSQPEEAFVKLYRLFRDDVSLKDFAVENDVNYTDYLYMAEFWYDARGNHTGRFLAKRFSTEYNQDHITFSKQDEAVGHSVRAMLCYLGATTVAIEKKREDFLCCLAKLWESVVFKKLHITGGIGANHSIEGFDKDYNLPNNAYLETCAAIGLAFWNTEMNIISPDSKYFDCFEKSLYNNVLGAIGDDFKHFFYQNPLESDGSLQRWDWHSTPCCPPMILKIFSSLNSFIYSYSNNSLRINMFIGSEYKNEIFSVSQSGNNIFIDSFGKKMTVQIRIPEYTENFALIKNGKKVEYSIENGYAVTEDIWKENTIITVEYDTPVRRMFCNSAVEGNHGKVAVCHGPYVMCAEGFDNNGNVDIEISENPQFTVEKSNVSGRDSDKNKFCLIPYYKWCNRGNSESDRKMQVWLRQENMLEIAELDKIIGHRLYAEYL